MIDLSYYIFNNIINIYSSQTHEIFDDAFDKYKNEIDK